MCDKERLRQVLLLDMKHWSADSLRLALNYVDGMVIDLTGDDFLWWWELRKDIRYELNLREAGASMYELEEKFSGMYDNPLPSMPPEFRCHEHIRRIDVRQTTTIAGRMDIDVVTMDGRLVTVQTSGNMTVGDIVNAICNAVS